MKGEGERTRDGKEKEGREEESKKSKELSGTAAIISVSQAHRRLQAHAAAAGDVHTSVT